jgi:hypothetical protein
LAQFESDREDGRDQAPLLGEQEDAEGAGDSQPERLGGGASGQLVDEQEVGLELDGEGEGLGFAIVEICGGNISRNVCWKGEAEPGWESRVFGEKLVADSRWE